MGDSLSLSCGAQGEPLPSVSWAFMGQAAPRTQPGLLHITNAQTNQSGTYTCLLKNVQTGAQLNKSVTVKIYGRFGFYVKGNIRSQLAHIPVL